jgi:hypothetical protein
MKTNQTAPKTIDEYIARFPKDIQEILEQVRLTIREAAPDAEEKISEFLAKRLDAQHSVGPPGADGVLRCAMPVPSLALASASSKAARPQNCR